ncbi:hypothetical protein J3Q64DRAFT_1713755 [Phycomyces blakesleeanus]|uniref:DUF4604 domain-containing protein n=2 Tax=Phycomyces blakesleeanus TaxID=4837 RepID=A0A167Q8V4_PHYB8|nr:hypothetical protein PHYBLDRAFT_139319 [Phycomyces blakesleeanus NRRL 1555(-)]OAD79286.1 hypothetical protein PHYBLDRAFT_139319 [Phycomyces blakesleeanus NRRL 1555(-)]|eukprot:XP_018297326.1 hypothetical protein PHYBLDRAFT_139319 [Phycomyces blakesleeanus NRRL 1555(-)]
MPKDPTPHQVSKGLTYVHKEPPFLARMKGRQEEKEQAMKKFLDYEDGDDDADYDELDGAQVVTFDDSGKEVHKDASDYEEEGEKDEKKEKAAVDETGRVLFCARKKKPVKSTDKDSKDKVKRKAEDKDTEEDKTKSQKKQKKQKKAIIALSFQEDE